VKCRWVNNQNVCNTTLQSAQAARGGGNTHIFSRRLGNLHFVNSIEGVESTQVFPHYHLFLNKNGVH